MGCFVLIRHLLLFKSHNWGEIREDLPQLLVRLSMLIIYRRDKKRNEKTVADMLHHGFFMIIMYLVAASCP